MRKLILFALVGYALRQYVKKNPTGFLATNPWARNAVGAMFMRR